MGTATIRTRQAGRLVEQVRYSHLSRSDTPAQRREKQQKTRAAMVLYNKKTSIQKFELMLAANFREGDCVVHLTYDDAHLPQSRKEAERRLQYFRTKMKAVYAPMGVDQVFFWSTEHKHGDARWHHHVVVTGTGDDYANIRAAWIYGKIMDFSPLEISEERNFRTLAEYLAKESRDKPGLRSWSYSRNAKHPEEERDTVDDSVVIRIPDAAGVVVLENRCDAVFGPYQYVKYLLPEWRPPRPHVPRSA